MNYKVLFLLFIIYSSFGWVIEICFTIFQDKKIVNRGFLIGPYCPIYGFGAIFMTLFLKRYSNDFAALFLMSMFICSVLEYFTSLIMEIVFKTRWWDYSHYKYNINGRICLETMIPFGLLGCLMTYILNPFFLKILNIIPNILLTIILIIVFVIFIVDVIISFCIIFKLKGITKNVRKDYTEEITEKVREILLSKSILYKRIVKAFPDMESKVKHKKAKKI